MKLTLPVLFSQRDSKWASILLGYNTLAKYNIGDWGCLITSLGCVVNKTPKEVNQILKDNGGFSQGGGDFVWSKAKVLGLNEIYVSPLYSGPVTNQGIAKIKELLDQRHPVLTHVDFNPATTKDDMHWVVIIGYEEGTDNFTIFDPWTGTITRLDVYGETRKAIWQFKAYDIVLPLEGSQETISVLKTQFSELVRKSTIADKVAEKLRKEVNETLIVGEVKRLVELEDDVREKDNKISDLTIAHDDLNSQLKIVTAKYDALNTKHDETIEQLKSITKKSDEVSKTIDEMGTTITELTEQVKSYEKQATTPIFTGWKQFVFDLIKRI